MSQDMIGYLLKKRNLTEGDRGLAYDYILAGNGLFLEAENPLIRARIRVAEATVRGLEPMTERVELVHGLVPSYLLAMALRSMREDINREIYLCVIEDEGYYRMQIPQQMRWGAGVKYHPVNNTVLDFHSHGRMGAHFSGTDDQDDQGFRVSAVIGRLEQPRAGMAMRLGVYGYYARVSFPEVFTGPLPTDLELAND